MNAPKVTVLMSVYNAEDNVSSAIKSILNQTFADFEFLIIDDGSTDRTGEVINSFNDSRICYFKNAINLGLTKSLNFGLSRARGEFIARIDADDLAAPLRLEKQIEKIEACGYVLVGSWSYVIDTNGCIVGRLNPLVDPDRISFKLFFSNSFIHSSCLFSACAAKALGGYDEKHVYAQDFDLWYRLSRVGKVFNIPEYLCYWRITPSGISNVKRSSQIKAARNIAFRNQRDLLGVSVDNCFLCYLNSFYGLNEPFELKYNRKDFTELVDAISKSSLGYSRCFVEAELSRLRLYFIEKNVFNFDSWKLNIYLSDFLKIEYFFVVLRVIIKKIFGKNMFNYFSRLAFKK